MKERIIENWLDNASERSYQPMFCQYLISKGYHVVHSTRHNASEHGKDIIAIDSAGHPCAYQLKGNPKGRITLDHYRKELVPQLSALTDQIIQHPSINKDIPHKSYFVTNGRLEEDVTIAITQKNMGNDSIGLSSRNLNVITRDELLSNFTSLERGLWPSEIEDTKTLLEILTTKGDDLFPQTKLHVLLSELLALQNDSVKPSVPSMKRRISSTMLLTSICLGSFYEYENHYAIIRAWSQTAVYLIASLTRWHIANAHFIDTLNVIDSYIQDSFTDLMDEVFERKNYHLGEGDLSTDYVIYGWRYTTLISLLSLALLSAQNSAINSNSNREQLISFLENRRIPLSILGECYIPGSIYYTWALQLIGSKENSSKLAFELATRALEGLPAVYYTPEQIIEDELSNIFSAFSPKIKKQSNQTSTWIARQAYINMVHLDLFEECQSLWKKYSLSTFKEYHPNDPWQFCILESNQGTNETFVPQIGCTWAELIEVSSFPTPNIIPTELSSRPLLLAVWTLIAPHRFTLGAMNNLAKAFLTNTKSDSR